ncbi:MAG TPA: hypothetical protein VG387_11555 [Rhizomicrobium sp.]|jgi:hypothetical protein|nr:hypothetical protein [Rhizomicrobium sp.]
MTARSKKAPKPKTLAMRKQTDAHPGIEIDDKGDVIPVEKRTTGDRAAVHRASAKRTD